MILLQDSWPSNCYQMHSLQIYHIEIFWYYQMPYGPVFPLKINASFKVLYTTLTRGHEIFSINENSYRSVISRCKRASNPQFYILDINIWLGCRFSNIMLFNQRIHNTKNNYYWLKKKCRFVCGRDIKRFSFYECYLVLL